MPLPGVDAPEAKECPARSEQPLGYSVKIGGCEPDNFEKDVRETKQVKILGQAVLPKHVDGTGLEEPMIWFVVEVLS